MIDDVHTVFSFEQSCWLEKDINGMAKQRAKVKGNDDVLAEIIKLAMNALYGTSLQNKLKTEVLQYLHQLRTVSGGRW